MKKINGNDHFCGDHKVEEVCKATIMLAETCSHYQVDVEEEIYLENERSCYNCRYRRWTHLGFSCLKEFPI